MKRAIYAGSFNPWSFGHQFVLDAASGVFSSVHVVAAVNPLKHDGLGPDVRARVIAHAISPFHDWWAESPPFHVGGNIVVDCTSGLIADYAHKQGITHLVRGLRSTSDFEAEFNLYFSNHAIDNKLNTWCIMCPPELLHCSSSFVNAVIGKQVSFVGTTFLAQCIMLNKSRFFGEIFDLIQKLSLHRFDRNPADLGKLDLYGALQSLFVNIINVRQEALSPNENLVDSYLRSFLNSKGAKLQLEIAQGVYPEHEIAWLWALLCVAQATLADMHSAQEQLARLVHVAPTLGKTEIPLFDRTLVQSSLEGIFANDKQSH